MPGWRDSSSEKVRPVARSMSVRSMTVVSAMVSLTRDGMRVAVTVTGSSRLVSVCDTGIEGFCDEMGCA
jgi:hypothetical protein